MKGSDRRKLINELRDLIYRITGNYYPEERIRIFEFKIERALKNMGMENSSPEAIVRYFAGEGRDVLIDLMTVPETRFFREREQLEVLADLLISETKFPEVASVGCSTGEEPYSLAMILASRGVRGRIVGFDISGGVLERARTGIYPPEEIKDIPDEYREFVILKEKFLEVRRDIRSMVTFHRANIIEASDFTGFRSSFHTALCRNVLIYFDKSSKKKALVNLHSILKDGGILVLSSTEILGKEAVDLFDPFKAGKFFFYRRKGA
ncbi:MAG: CheR family methyltransferase [Aquificota bacterium]|nr:CheR family methyltransferase [Aquificota bacterium]